MRDERTPSLATNSAGTDAHAQAEKVLDLTREDDHGDAAREADDHGVRNELDHAAELRDAHHDQHDAGHERRDDQSVDAVLLHDAVHDDDERAGRAADLHARAAERGDEKAGDDRGAEPAVGRDAAAMANAIASGIATMPTMMPAIRSRPSCRRSYDDSTVTSLGTSDAGVGVGRETAVKFEAPRQITRNVDRRASDWCQGRRSRSSGNS